MHFTADEMARFDAPYLGQRSRPASITIRCQNLESASRSSIQAFRHGVNPRPAEDDRFFQGLLEGIASVEALAYERLALLGAPPLRRVISVGGGARNEAWTLIRQRILDVPVTVAEQTEACYGAALLALQGGPP